jgi:YD repeat-containing protein
MKAYKATYNMKCETLTYEVGKTYSITSMEMCDHGFHFCPVMSDVLEFYPYHKDFILMEVEILGKRVIKREKGLTDKMRVVRIVPPEEYEFDIPEQEKADEVTCVYDERGNVISKTYHNNIVYTYEYDDRNNVIVEGLPNGRKKFNTYDERNNLIRREDGRGYRAYTYGYDERNNKIFMKYPSGEQWAYGYDERNNNTYCISPEGLTTRYEYDERGNITRRIDHDGRCACLTYDEHNRRASIRYSDGDITTWNYDEQGNLIEYSTTDGSTWRITIE